MTAGPCSRGSRGSRWQHAQAPHSPPSSRYPAVFIAIAVFVVDGVYIICKLAILSYMSLKARRVAAAKARAEAEQLERRAPGGPLPGTIPSLAEEGGSPKKDKIVDSDVDSDDGEHRLLGGETEFERTLRRRVFLNGAIPWCGRGPAAAASRIAARMPSRVFTLLLLADPVVHIHVW